MPDGTFAGTSGDRRSCLLPREVRGGSGRDRRHSGEHCEDASVLCAQEIGRTAEGSRHRTRLAMMAASKKMLDQESSEIDMLLPWHAAGTLNARDARRVDEALAQDPELARQYAVIREEYAETIALNESLGAPSARAMAKLFAAIDGEPVRKPSVSSSISARASGFFARLSPRTLAWSASLGAVVLLLQAGVIGAVLMKNQTASFQTASLSLNEPSAAP